MSMRDAVVQFILACKAFGDRQIAGEIRDLRVTLGSTVIGVSYTENGRAFHDTIPVGPANFKLRE